MKIKDAESVEDRYLRENYLYSHRKGEIPLLLAIFLVLIVCVTINHMISPSYRLEARGNGNPYMCSSCKNLGYACKEHVDFDKTDYLDAKVLYYTTRYNIGDSDENSLYAMYGYGKTFNSECDFCKENESECYSCKHDRMYITSLIEDISTTDVFKTKLCDNCWALGYADCQKCYEVLAYEVMATIKGEEVNLVINKD